jgi:hypothetical protein
MTVRIWVSVLLMCLVGACASKPPPQPHVAAAPPAAPADPSAACMAGLDQRHVQFERSQDFKTAEGCGIDGAVKMKGASIPLNRPLLLACRTSASLADFESQVVVPAAQEMLGHGVTVMTSAGSYDCRGQRSDHPERLSEHGKGRAVDITGFTLDDGTKISVLRNWSGHDAKAEFLHKVAAGACKMFAVVLTPKSNALHRDHLHLDNGPHKKCDG